MFGVSKYYVFATMTQMNENKNENDNTLKLCLDKIPHVHAL
jgi:hypothetical protein